MEDKDPRIGRSGRPLATHYSASKFGVISVTRSAALALAPFGVWFSPWRF